MYNLFITGGDEAWSGEPFDLELSRCVSPREYTDEALAEQFGALGPDQLKELLRLPCIFGWEAGWNRDPKFGLIDEVTKRRTDVRIRYKIIPVEPFLTHEQLAHFSIDLDIGKWELNRTHWALKNVSLARELFSKAGIVLPDWAGKIGPMVDIAKHNFEVGLSFPGETREYVEQVALELERGLGPHTYFYDNNYVAQLARPALDALLQDLYGNRCRLIVVFLSGAYDAKDWCGIEFRAVREILMARDHERVMYVKMDDGVVEGVLKTDGYVDARIYSPRDIAKFIAERVSILQAKMP